MATKTARKPRVVTEIDQKEQWQSTIDGVIWVHTFDRNGRDTEVAIKGGGTIKLLPEEREINQENVAEPSQDPFLNGYLVPLKLVESAEGYESLKGNPNHLTEADMGRLLDNPSDIKSLETAIADVTNPATLQRFLHLANSEDDTTRRQIKTIETRLDAVLNPVVDDDAEVVEIESIGAEGHTAFATRAPKSVAPENPGMGRRKRRD